MEFVSRNFSRVLGNSQHLGALCLLSLPLTALWTDCNCNFLYDTCNHYQQSIPLNYFQESWLVSGTSVHNSWVSWFYFPTRLQSDFIWLWKNRPSAWAFAWKGKCWNTHLAVLTKIPFHVYLHTKITDSHTLGHVFCSSHKHDILPEQWWDSGSRKEVLTKPKSSLPTLPTLPSPESWLLFEFYVREKGSNNFLNA